MALDGVVAVASVMAHLPRQRGAPEVGQRAVGAEPTKEIDVAIEHGRVVAGARFGGERRPGSTSLQPGAPPPATIERPEIGGIAGLGQPIYQPDAG